MKNNFKIIYVNQLDTYYVFKRFWFWWVRYDFCNFVHIYKVNDIRYVLMIMESGHYEFSEMHLLKRTHENVKVSFYESPEDFKEKNIEYFI